MKASYIKPVVEIIETEAENTIMTGSQNFNLNEADENYNDAAYSRKNGFWD